MTRDRNTRVVDFALRTHSEGSLRARARALSSSALIARRPVVPNVIFSLAQSRCTHARTHTRSTRKIRPLLSASVPIEPRAGNVTQHSPHLSRAMTIRHPPTRLPSLRNLEFGAAHFPSTFFFPLLSSLVLFPMLVLIFENNARLIMDSFGSSPANSEFWMHFERVFRPASRFC